MRAFKPRSLAREDAKQSRRAPEDARKASKEPSQKEAGGGEAHRETELPRMEKKGLRGMIPVGPRPRVDLDRCLTDPRFSPAINSAWTTNWRSL